jgi:hypothetical protein
MRRWIIGSAVGIICSGFSIAQVPTISGTVTDAVTGEPLIAANIRVEGTTRGTISNNQGFYKLSLNPGSYRLVFSYIGYRTDTLTVTLTAPFEYHVRLQPYPIQLSEIVVTDEDPGRRIMRRVIENKKHWVDALKSYEFEAFTRLVLRRDTTIASILESYSTGYWQAGDTLREIVKQKRQTANIPAAVNFAAVGGIVNFYQDDIRLGGFRFVGPTSSEAFEYYDFKLEETKELGGISFYKIRLIPLSRVTPLFRGFLQIVSDGYAVVGVEVSPNEAFTLPFISEFDFIYAQQFSLYEERFWMPVDIRINGWAKVSLAGFSFPKFGFEQISTIYEYKINQAIPDSIFRKPRRIEVADAAKIDSLFWAQREVLPLTSEQQQAYRTIDSTQTLSRQFQPTGPLTRFSSSLSRLQYFDLRFNRVEGFFVGGKVRRDSLIGALGIGARVGYGFSDQRWKFGITLSHPLESRWRTSVSAEGFVSTAHIPDEEYYDAFTISLGALFDKNDYRDYYYTKGGRLSISTRPTRRMSMRVELTSEEHRNALQSTDYSFFSRNRTYRPQPEIQEGKLRAWGFLLRFGQEQVPFGILSQDYFELEMEHSFPSVLASSFDYSRFVLRGELHVPTFSQRLLFPPLLSAHARIGLSRGSLPPQRLFSLDSRYSGIGPFGVLRTAETREFSGDRFVMLTLEHNFRSVPFLLLDIPFLYKNGLELIVFGSVARSWARDLNALAFGRTTQGWHTEAGFGISRVLGFLRFDLAYRFNEPRNFLFSLGLARIL